MPSTAQVLCYGRKSQNGQKRKKCSKCEFSKTFTGFAIGHAKQQDHPEASALELPPASSQQSWQSLPDLREARASRYWLPHACNSPRCLRMLAIVQLAWGPSSKQYPTHP